MSVPLLFESKEMFREFMFIGWFVVILAALSVIRRVRWNRGRYNIFHTRWIVFLVCCVLLYVASAGIAQKVVFLWTDIKPETEPTTVFVWLDASKSSLARDVPVSAVAGEKAEVRYISRHAMAKKEIEGLLPHLLNNKVFFGIFGDEAYPVVPLQIMTVKSIANFRAELEQITEKTVARMNQGTNLGRVLIATSGYLPPSGLSDDEGTPCVPRMVVILTDGEPVGKQDELTKDLEEGSARMRRLRCISIYLVGIGNPDKPSRIPILNERGEPTGEYETGKDEMRREGIIATKPNFKFLYEIAKTVRGEFLDGRSGSELKTALKDILGRTQRIVGYKPEIKQILLAWHLAVAMIVLLLLVNPFRNFLS
ncbi:MAG: VWA domain-containing protein [Candidatus Sungbacteria bacterium]|nr:VWA domain-containing protein [Candidatus Sungbacteria bacterium]